MNKQFKMHQIPTARAVSEFDGFEVVYQYGIYDYIDGFVQPPLTPSQLTAGTGGFFWAQGEWVLFTQDENFPYTQVEVDDYVSTPQLGSELYTGGDLLYNTADPSGTVIYTEAGAPIEADTTYQFSYQSVLNTGTIVVEIGNASQEIDVSETSSFQLTPSVAGTLVIKVGDAPLDMGLGSISLKEVEAVTTTGDGYAEVEDYIWWKNQWLRVTGQAEWTKMGRRYYRILRVEQTDAGEGFKEYLRVPPPSFDEVSAFVQATNSLEINMQFNVEPPFNELIDALNGV